MKQFANLPQLLDAPLPVRIFIGKVIGVAKAPFDEALGGDVFLVESQEDLADLVIDYFSGANVLETAGQIDLAEWIDKEKTYAVFYSATNDAGGPSYFVPASLVAKNENLKETMRLTQAMHAKVKRGNRD